MLRAQNAVVIGPSAPSLVHWGRSVDADLVYRALVTLGPGTAGELERELGLSRRRVASALDELLSIEAVQARPVTARRAAVWVATPPARVVASLRRRRFQQPAPVPPADPVADAPALVEGTGVRHLRTRVLSRERLAELHRVAAHEQLSMTPEHEFEPEAGRTGVVMDRHLLSRGVRMRVLGVHPSSPDPMLQHGRRADEPGPDYRAARSVPMKLIIVDRKVALFPVDPGDVERGYLEMSQPPVVSALVALFERHWEAARDPWDLAAPRIALDHREHALVTLLAHGHTDTSAAAELRISARTVTSIMRGLMDRVGADNRFQLGLVLGRLGAVAPPARSTRSARRPR